MVKKITWCQTVRIWDCHITIVLRNQFQTFPMLLLWCDQSSHLLTESKGKKNYQESFLLLRQWIDRHLDLKDIEDTVFCHILQLGRLNKHSFFNMKDKNKFKLPAVLPCKSCTLRSAPAFVIAIVHSNPPLYAEYMTHTICRFKIVW